MPFDGTTYRDFGGGHDPAPTPHPRGTLLPAVAMGLLSAQGALLAVLSLTAPHGTTWHSLTGAATAWYCGCLCRRFARGARASAAGRWP